MKKKTVCILLWMDPPYVWLIEFFFLTFLLIQCIAKITIGSPLFMFMFIYNLGTGVYLIFSAFPLINFVHDLEIVLASSSVPICQGKH